MSGSLIVAVRKNLLAALKPVIVATTGMEQISVGFQYQTGDNEPAESVWSQNSRMDLVSASLRVGKNFLDETGHFDVIVKTDRADTNAEDAAQRAIDIGQVVVDWLGNHKNGETLGLTGLQTLIVDGSGSATESKSLTGSGIAAYLQIPIQFTARLT